MEDSSASACRRSPASGPGGSGHDGGLESTYLSSARSVDKAALERTVGCNSQNNIQYSFSIE